jgi:hypothetical protein
MSRAFKSPQAVTFIELDVSVIYQKFIKGAS